MATTNSENWCYGHSGHRVFDYEAGTVHVECDECGRRFDDPDNTGGLPFHEQAR